MKKKLSLILCLIIIFGLTGCGVVKKSETRKSEIKEEEVVKEEEKEEAVEEVKVPTLEIGKTYGSGNVYMGRSLEQITLNSDGTVSTSNCVRDGGCIDGRGTYKIDGTTLTITITETYMIMEWEKLPVADVETWTITADNTFTRGEYTYTLEG